MALTTLFDVLFAAAVVVAALALVGAALRQLSRGALATATGLIAAAAVAGWVAFALRHSHPRELAVSAGGLTVAALVASAALLLRRALQRAEASEIHLLAAQRRLKAVIDEEAVQRAAELERTLARARADSVSILIEEERRIAEERRSSLAERERVAADAMTETLTTTQAQVELRLAGWAQDLDRAAEVTKMRIAELELQQKQLIAAAGHRLTADADRLATESENQRAALARVRADLDKAMEDTVGAAHAEVEQHAAERRRALQELDERMRRREQELLERIEREEAEAVQRIQSGFEDVHRRQLEQMTRIVDRALSTHSDLATQQFADLVKAGREDAARRLGRELDRAVEVFARGAEAALAERLAHVGDSGAQRLEHRLEEAAKSLARQQDEWTAALDGRFGELEADVRRRLEDLEADTDAGRAVLEARLQELARRVGAADTLQRTP
jgi:hypothetical protein